MDQRDRFLASVAAEPRIEIGAIRSNLGGVQDLRLDALPIALRNLAPRISLPGGLVVLTLR